MIAPKLIASRAMAGALAALLAAAPAAAAFLESPVGEVVTVPSRAGVTVRYFAWTPDGPPRATVLLFTGGHGMLNISGPRPGPTWSDSGNFLTRSREYFRRRGLQVAAIDVPSDRADGYKAFRVTAEHGADIAAVVGDLRRKLPDVPVWLVGTSAGTLSAANGAARLPSGTIAGAVLTATVTRGGHPKNEMGGTSIYDTDLSRIRVPMLLAHHRGDACVFSPFAGMEALRARLIAAPRLELLAFEGGDPPISGPCEPRAAHGFFGIEEQTANAIADWILAAKS